MKSYFSPLQNSKSVCYIHKFNITKFVIAIKIAKITEGSCQNMAKWFPNSPLNMGSFLPRQMTFLTRWKTMCKMSVYPSFIITWGHLNFWCLLFQEEGEKAWAWFLIMWNFAINKKSHALLEACVLFATGLEIRCCLTSFSRGFPPEVRFEFITCI